MASPPVRLLNFISEQEVAEIRKKRGELGEAESTLPEKPLFEILKENKDKQQAEFNERFKHQPPKALDEDETEFLERLEMYKREQEMELANDEAQQLLNFQAAVASRTIAPEESKSYFHQPKELVSASQKEKRPVRPISTTIRIKPQPKKAKVDKIILTTFKERHEPTLKPTAVKLCSTQADDEGIKFQERSNTILGQGLVAYGTDSDDEDEPEDG